MRDVAAKKKALAMNIKRGFLVGLVLLVCSMTAWAAGPTPPGSLDTDRYHVSYVKMGAEDLDGLLYEPKSPGTNAHIALVSVFPRAGFGSGAPEELAARGFRVVKIVPYVEHDSPYDGVKEASAAIAYLRTLPGVDHVLIMGHSGGAHLTAFYTNVALNGPKGCQYPQLLYPCRADLVTGLSKPDGAVLLDPGVGPINSALSVDPAYAGDRRTAKTSTCSRPPTAMTPRPAREIIRRSFSSAIFFCADRAQHADREPCGGAFEAGAAGQG